MTLAISTCSPRTARRSTIHYPAALDEARRMIAEHDRRAHRVVENRIADQLAKGDVAAALHLDQVRRALAQVGPACG